MKQKDIYKDKVLLILAGAAVHCKVVEAAKALGVKTIVIDYLEHSPAKSIADESYVIDINDYDAIEKLCSDKGVDGILSAWIDPCQRCYAEICTRLNYPTYCTPEQVFKMTDKHAFKEMCRQFEIGVIPEYTLQDCIDGNVDYPLFVKPVDSRGSRGQSVCHNISDVLKAVDIAKTESSNEEYLIEKYVEGAQEFQVTYFFVDGVPYLVRTADSYVGSEENRLNKVVACAISPSRYTDLYLENVHSNVIKMFNALGFKNGPIFMQGFVKDNKFYFFDLGMRFPGVDYEKIIEDVYGISFMEMLVKFSLTGYMPPIKNDYTDIYNLNDNVAAVLFPTVKCGQIYNTNAYTILNDRKEIVSVLPRADVGDLVPDTRDVNQRLCEIDLYNDTLESLCDSISTVNKKIIVEDISGTDMIFERFDVSKLLDELE